MKTILTACLILSVVCLASVAKGISGSRIFSSSTVDVGYAHSCSVHEGAAYCWGWNFYGQLGTNIPDNAAGPKLVQGLESDVSDITTGNIHSCAVHNGGIKCWGKNTFGQLGNNSREDSSTPVPVKGFAKEKNILAIDANRTMTCAVSNGGLYCWGWDRNCLFGDSNWEPPQNKRMFLTPQVILPENSGVTDVALGEFHICALVNKGAMCWGSTLLGKVGDGSDGTSHIKIPQYVKGLGAGSSVTAITAGPRHSCAVVNESKVFCWGQDRYIGNGKMEDAHVPTAVPHLPAGLVTQIKSFDNTTCVNVDGSEIYCWGDGSSGQLGTGRISQFAMTPVKVKGLENTHITDLAVGTSHACAIANGHLKCWGWNSYCQLGISQCSGKLSDIFPLPMDVLN